ncbi:MAG: GH36-type glycosyl hydrolase domain-containing protein [Halanaerobiales bacterium]
MYQKITARSRLVPPEKVLEDKFATVINGITDSVYLSLSHKQVIGVSNLPFKSPAVLQLLNNKKINRYINFLFEKENISLLIINDDELIVYSKETGKEIKKVDLPQNIRILIKSILSKISSWAGDLNKSGEHIVDLTAPSPGPHFNVNLLLGNRMGHKYPLQTTPKSVVDKLGRGSFRSHAATQVLATRWDMLAEENGFPANRQFYIVENSKKIFYSASADGDNIESAICTHSQNKTKIKYKTKCGLMIERTIFILPQYEGLPMATEVQQIKIKNTGKQDRDLKIIYTGMFGSAAPHALFEDVLYSNIIMQSEIWKIDDGSIVVISPDYYPEYTKEDIRFNIMLVHNGNKTSFPKNICTDYNQFVGNGTLENPEGLLFFANRASRKGPGFFALSSDIALAAGEESIVNNFTGLVSSKEEAELDSEIFQVKINNLIEKFNDPEEVDNAITKTEGFYNRYSSFVNLKSLDKKLNSYVNNNLPFQILYQTFVSRSFAQTQKGYREIGFREIQDIFASMYYFIAMGESIFVKDLLLEWGAKVFELGYAYHNFYWEGKEPGKWSDDALWFIQAVYRYINQSGDMSILDQEVEIAGTEPVKKRTVYQTIKNIINYSARISIGKHGLPLLDNADWNDCLKLDNDFIDGITKEKMYHQQLEGDLTGDFEVGEKPFESNYSESVMNAFLLKVAVDNTRSLALKKDDSDYENELDALASKLYENIQKHAWKDNFFARVLFNRYDDGEYTFLGAKGDGLSANPEIEGTYFLNSFTWSILSGCAEEDQIGIMLDVVDRYLKTPYGYKVLSPTDLEKVAKNTATGEYFPGDRENGGVFKHASMMATKAMLQAAKEVENSELAARLVERAYWMIDLVFPYKTMDNPFEIAGNPRFCTQYNNSETGENIGPILSGTASWLSLSLFSLLGIEFNPTGINIDPVMRINETVLNYTLNLEKSVYEITISKPVGFYRVKDSETEIIVDGKPIKDNNIPLFQDKKIHTVNILFK